MSNYDSTLNTIYGGSELQAFVTDPLSERIDTIYSTIDAAIQGALDKVIDEGGDISYQPKPLNEISTQQPNTGDLDMNNKRVTNMATLDISSIDAILATSQSAVNVQTMSAYNTFNVPAQIASLTNTILPLSTTTSMRDRRIIDVLSPEELQLLNPDETQQVRDQKNKQVVTQGFMRNFAVVQNLRRGDNQEIINNQPTTLPYDCFRASGTSETGVAAVIVQGVADPVRPWDAVNKRKLDEEIKGCHQVNEDVDVQDQYRVIRLPDPNEAQHAVNKRYCDSNSRNSDGTGLLTGLLGGALGGAIGSALTSALGSGLTTFGQLTGSLAAGTAALTSAMKLGGTADFNRYAPGPGESQQLINNLKDDIANRPAGAPDGASLLNGAMSVTGLFRAVQNAQIGLFDLVN